jgi:hypothetical protein
MAGSWIKFDTSTSDKPEVWSMACELGIDPDAVVGKLLRVWTWFDDHTEKGNAPIVTRALLDRRVGVTGFVTAMINAGWMSETDGVLSVPNFDRHNGQTAKNRVLTAVRVAHHKKGNAKGNGAIVTDALPKEEKSREDNTHTHTHKKTTNRGTQPVVPEDLAVCWSRWIEYHFAKHGSAVPAIQAEAILMDLGRRGADKAARDIEFSIRKDAKSILDSDNDFEKRQSATATYSKPVRKRNYE